MTFGQILKRQYVGDQFRDTNTLLVHALDELPREELEISDEVREQVSSVPYLDRSR